MSLRQAAQQALEALEWNYNTDLDNIPACEQWAKMLNETITALKQALAEPEQEPAAWMYDFLNPNNREEVIRNWVTQNPDDIEREKGFNVRPLHTAPTPRKPLTDGEINRIVAQHVRITDQNLSGAVYMAMRDLEAAHGIGEQT